MILKEFPDINWLKRQIKSNFENRKTWENIRLKQSGWPSVILNVKTSGVERTAIKGPFTLFMNHSGKFTANLLIST